MIAARALAGAALCLLLPLAAEVGVFFGRKRFGTSWVATLLHALVLVKATVALLAFKVTKSFI